MKRITVILFCLLHILSAGCKDLAALSRGLEEAKALNSAQRYSDAYRKAVRLHSEMDSMIQTSDDGATLELCLKVLNLEAECAYMLDFYRELGTLCTQYQNLLQRAEGKISGMAAYEAEKEKMLGSLCYCKDPDSAEIHYRNALGILEKVKYSDHLTVTVKEELAQLYYKQKLYDKAERIIKEIIKYYRLYDKSQTAKWRGNLALCKARNSSDRYEEALSDVNRAIKEAKEYPAVRYELQRKRGKILMFSGKCDSALTCYREYMSYMKKDLASRMRTMSEGEREQAWLGIHSFMSDCNALASSAPEFVYDNMLYLRGYRSNRWQDIKASLDSESCAVEFVVHETPKGGKELSALVVTSKCRKPRFVSIADMDELEGLVLGNGVRLSKALSSVSAYDKNAIYRSDTLKKSIWNDALLKAVSDSRKIYFAPDGILHALAIEYMYPDSVHSLYRLSSTGKLLKRARHKSGRGILLCGGIDFSAKIDSAESGNDRLAYEILKGKASSISSLPGTKSEVDSISSCFGADVCKVLKSTDATDEKFSSMAGKYGIVHVASHGYFVGELDLGTDLKPLYSDNTLSNSGLVFAGAGNALSDSGFDADRHDGLISAREMSKIRLDSVDLVVLSACRSGSGEITPDGVYGMQRALKTAGVKSMIVSLWNVDDKATSILMTSFYRNMEQRHMGTKEAFEKARDQLRSIECRRFNAATFSSKKVQKYNAPMYSDAFIMIDITE